MQVRPIKTRVFREREHLVSFIRAHIEKLPERSVLVVTSKIISLAEGRTARYRTLLDKQRVIRNESDIAVPMKQVWMSFVDGILVASAGIDESNADGKLILLPKDSYRSAARLRQALMKAYKLKQLAVVISDSRTTPLRRGVIGIAIGYAGMKGVRDYRGEKDLFGRKFQFERVNIADSIATAATIVMGEGAERQPLALVTGASVEFSAQVEREELIVPLEEDVYVSFLKRMPKRLPKKRRR